MLVMSKLNLSLSVRYILKYSTIKELATKLLGEKYVTKQSFDYKQLNNEHISIITNTDGHIPCLSEH